MSQRSSGHARQRVRLRASGGSVRRLRRGGLQASWGYERALRGGQRGSQDGRWRDARMRLAARGRVTTGARKGLMEEAGRWGCAY